MTATTTTVARPRALARDRVGFGVGEIVDLFRTDDGVPLVSESLVRFRCKSRSCAHVSLDREGATRGRVLVLAGDVQALAPWTMRHWLSEDRAAVGAATLARAWAGRDRLTLVEAAASLGVSASTLRRVCAGKLLVRHGSVDRAGLVDLLRVRRHAARWENER